MFIQGIIESTNKFLSVIFKGSNLYRLSELQKAMGHSNIMVSLTYLRGLDVAELKQECQISAKNIRYVWSIYT